MPKAKAYEQNGSERGTLNLPDHLFGCDVNEAVIHQAVVTYLANQRQGDASTKERSDVRGGGKKPFRQKGTGRARAGTIRSPIYRGGGVVFGPHPRSYRKALPKKVRRLALRSSLSSHAKSDGVLIVDDFEYKEPKTRQFADLLRKLDIYGQKILVVVDKADAAVIKSCRNIPSVKTTLGTTLNTYDIVWADKIMMTQSSLKSVEELFK